MISLEAAIVDDLRESEHRDGVYTSIHESKMSSVPLQRRHGQRRSGHRHGTDGKTLSTFPFFFGAIPRVVAARRGAAADMDSATLRFSSFSL